MQKEVDYTQLQIKKLTPYLDHITQPAPGRNNKNKFRPLKNNHRAFAWYFVFNNNNIADAYNRMRYGTFNPQTEELDVVFPQNRKTKTSFPAKSAMHGGVLYRKPYIKECIKLIQDKHCEHLLLQHRQSYIEQLQKRAYYNINLFFDEQDRPKPFSEIPPEYHCCIDGIERKRYGKDGDYVESIYKLADKDKARAELAKLTPQFNISERFEVLHKTINSSGSEIGIMSQADLEKLSIDELKKLSEGL